MKIEDQVTCLELSKKLKELGVKQESLFYWTDDIGSIIDGKQTRQYRVSMCPISKLKIKGMVYKLDKISAFTVAELGELLPKDFIHKQHVWLENGYDPELKYWWVAYLEVPVRGTRVYPLWEQDESEADARAEMLIYLLEKKLI